MVVSEKPQTGAPDATNSAARSDQEDLWAVQPLGFSFYNEKMNGRAAMAGFMIGLATEVLSKDHVTIAGQIGMLLAPVTGTVEIVGRQLAIISQTM